MHTLLHMHQRLLFIQCQLLHASYLFKSHEKHRKKSKCTCIDYERNIKTNKRIYEAYKLYSKNTNKHESLIKIRKYLSKNWNIHSQAVQWIKTTHIRAIRSNAS